MGKQQQQQVTDLPGLEDLPDAGLCAYLSPQGKALVHAARPLSMGLARDNRFSAAFAVPRHKWDHHAHHDLVIYLAWATGLPDPGMLRVMASLEEDHVPGPQPAPQPPHREVG